MTEATETNRGKGRPKTGRVRMAIRVTKATKRRISAMMDDTLDTPGKVVDLIFAKEGE